MQAHQSKHCIGGSTSRERDVCVCVRACVRACVEFRQFVFRLRISKFCVDLRKKYLIVRDDVERFQFLSTISEVQY